MNNDKRIEKLEQRVKAVEKKIAELVEEVQPKENFIPEDSDGILDSTKPSISRHEWELNQQRATVSGETVSSLDPNQDRALDPVTGLYEGQRVLNPKK